jgi:hypothetical protein
MEALLALSNTSHDWAAPAAAGGGGLADPERTLYTIGIIVCLALLLLWYGMVRRPG